MNSHKLFFYKQNLLVTIDGDWLICFVCITKVTVGASTNLVFVCDSLLVNFMLDIIPVITGMRSNIKLTNKLFLRNSFSYMDADILINSLEK